MKTFKQLTVGDKIYEVKEGQMKYEAHEVKKVELNNFHYSYSDQFERLEKTSSRIQEDRWGRGYARYLFTNEAMAIRYCKAQMMKSLFSLISGAKKAIQSVSEFRQEHFELLSHEWTEKQINILERQL